MSDFGEVKERRKRFLQVAYEAAEGNPSELIEGREVARRLGLDLFDAGPQAEEFYKLAGYHTKMGNVEPLESSYGILRITAKGVDEVERAMLMAPALSSSDSAGVRGGRKEKRRRFLGAIYDLSGGSTNQFVYWRNVAPRLGLDADNPEHEEEALGIADYLASSGLITIEVDEGTVYRITVAGIDEVEDEPASGFGVPYVPQDESEDATKIEAAPYIFGRVYSVSEEIIQTPQPSPSSSCNSAILPHTRT